MANNNTVIVHILKLVDLIIDKMKRYSYLHIIRNIDLNVDFVENEYEIKSIEYFLNKIKKKLMNEEFETKYETEIVISVIYFIINFEKNIANNPWYMIAIPNEKEYFSFFKKFYIK